MNCKLARNFAVIPAALAALASIALLLGCKGNTTSAAGLEKHVGPPPKVLAKSVMIDPTDADPLTDAVWTKSQWYSLVSPANTSHTTPPVRVAMRYDAANLYVAFISDTVPPLAAPIAQDVVSVYLDSSKLLDGTELAQVNVDSEGHCSCQWIRCGTAAQPKEDGSPDYTHPVSKIPDVTVKGLRATVRQGASVWTAVAAIPMKNLPMSLRTTAKPGDHWKINLLRTVTTADTGAGVQQVQANLSPVYPGAQAISPYRMAELTLGAGE